LQRRQSHIRERDYRYAAVMRALVWRYIIAMHRRQELSEVTEVDVNEVKGGISTLRFELLEVFKNNGMDISCAIKNTKSKSRDVFNSFFDAVDHH
jgi:transient-receptor-potential-like protein